MLCGEKKHTLFHTDKVQIKCGCIALAQAASSCDYSYLYVLCCSLALILLLGPPVRAQKGFSAPCYWFLTCSGAPGEDKVEMCVFLLMFASQVPAPRILEFNSLPGLELGVILLCFFHFIQACGDYCNAGVLLFCFFFLYLLVWDVIHSLVAPGLFSPITLLYLQLYCCLSPSLP